MPGADAEDRHVFSDRGSPLAFVEHEAIIQTLDRESNGKFLTKAAFEPSVEDWNEAHLIFAQDHPDPDKFDKDPEAELERIKGRLVQGTARDARIEMTGHPTLRITFDLEDDEIEKGIEDGTISTSNCFFCKDDGKKLTGSVRPHHILFFIEKGKDTPGDRGVLILNKEREEIKLIDRLKTLILGGKAGADDNTEEEEMTDKELETKLANATKDAADAKLAFTQLRTDVDELKGSISAKDAEIKRLNDELKAFKTKEADGRWAAFKAKHVPPGMVEGDKEKAARAEFESSPYEFMEKVLEFRAENAEGAGDEGAEPMQYTASKAKARSVSVDAELRKFGATNVSVKEA